jgi:hypothetical protein
MGEVALRDDAATGRFDDTHHNAYGELLLIDPSYEDLANFLVSKNVKWLQNIGIHNLKYRPIVGSQAEACATICTYQHCKRWWHRL